MSAAFITALRELTARVEALEKRNAPVAGALEAVLAAIQDLSKRMDAQEQRRCPGRPPKGQR